MIKEVFQTLLNSSEIDLNSKSISDVFHVYIINNFKSIIISIIITLQVEVIINQNDI